MPGAWQIISQELSGTKALGAGTQPPPLLHPCGTALSFLNRSFGKRSCSVCVRAFRGRVIFYRGPMEIEELPSHPLNRHLCRNTPYPHCGEQGQ